MMMSERSRLIYAAFLIAFSVSILSGCAAAGNNSLKELSDVYYNLGNAYYQLKDFEKAERAYGNSLYYNPESFPSAYNLSAVYVELREYDKALDLIRNLLTRDADNTVLIKTLAGIYELRGSTGKASSQYEKLLEIDPGDHDSRVMLIKLYMEDEKLTDAERHLEWFKEYRIFTKEVLLLLWEFDENREEGSGLSWLEEGFRMYPEDYSLRSLLLKVFLDNDYVERAKVLTPSASENLTEENSASENSAVPPEMLYQLARYYLLTGETDKSREYLDSARNQGYEKREIMKLEEKLNNEGEGGE
ncbi:MAG: tetratricopeptide repeat protein [Spirochaetia bacterium]|nr:tetratricopeptide repeat protein [Spirochaetia bacterium]MCF7946616.1 tetratricopeptide repeat protein [Spirochaetia bacterium]MCF7952814.1 tetratricopeptide repeat protein [Spirochaetales bacterium]